MLRSDLLANVGELVGLGRNELGSNLVDALVPRRELASLVQILRSSLRARFILGHRWSELLGRERLVLVLLVRVDFEDIFRSSVHACDPLDFFDFLQCLISITGLLEIVLALTLEIGRLPAWRPNWERDGSIRTDWVGAIHVDGAYLFKLLQLVLAASSWLLPVTGASSFLARLPHVSNSLLRD